MTRQRKAASKADMNSQIPPSETKPAEPLIEITEDEQWRLINQSGILQNAALVQESTTVESTEEVEEDNFSLCDEIFNAVMLIIPFSSLLLLMEMYVSHNMSHPVIYLTILCIQPYPPSIRQNCVFRYYHGQNATWRPKYVQLSQLSM